MQEILYQEKAEMFDFDRVDSEISLFCEENALPESKRYAILLVIEEIVTIIVKYGEMQECPRHVAVNVRLRDGRVVITIKDNTKAYDFNADREEPDVTLDADSRDIGGLGLFLVGKMVESSTYRHLDGENYFEAVLK